MEMEDDPAPTSTKVLIGILITMAIILLGVIVWLMKDIVWLS